MAELKRTLGLPEASFFAVGVILGAGIYTIVGEVAGQSGNMIWASFLLSSVTALLTCFAYAELCAMMPKAGGEFTYVKETISPKAGYSVGVAVAMCGILGVATISVAFAGYAGQLLDINSGLLALGIITALLIINISGIRHSSTTNIIFTLIEILGLGMVVWGSWDKIGSIDYLEVPENGVKAIISGAALSFFAFTGFEDTVKLAEETRKPEINIPRALFLSISLVIVIYLIVVVASVSAIPADQLGGSSSPLAMIVESEFGKKGALIITAIALFSTSNSLLSNMLGASRITYGMAKEKEIGFLSKVSGRTRTPVTALILIALIAGSLSLIGNIKTLASIANIFVLVTFLMVNLSVIYYRVSNPSVERPFKIPWSIKSIPVIPIIAILLILLLGGFSVYSLMS